MTQGIFFVSVLFFSSISYGHEGHHKDQQPSASAPQVAPRSDDGSDTEETVGYYNPHAGQWIEVESQKTTSLKASPHKKQKTISRYNPYSKEWEETTPDAVLTYNQHAGVWSYQKQGTTSRYNPHTNQWEEATADAPLKYDANKDTWVYQNNR